MDLIKAPLRITMVSRKKINIRRRAHSGERREISQTDIRRRRISDEKESRRGINPGGGIAPAMPMLVPGGGRRLILRLMPP